MESKIQDFIIDTETDLRMMRAARDEKAQVIKNSSYLLPQVFNNIVARRGYVPYKSLDTDKLDYEIYKKLLTEIIAHHCKKPFKKVLADAERNFYMNPTEAKEYGLIDSILTPEQGLAAIKNAHGK